MLKFVTMTKMPHMRLLCGKTAFLPCVSALGQDLASKNQDGLWTCRCTGGKGPPPDVLGSMCYYSSSSSHISGSKLRKNTFHYYYT